MPDGLITPSHMARQSWMALLARAHRTELEQAWATISPQPAYTLLRKPEGELAMVRGRAGGTGNPFNLGEMTMIRCAVRLDDAPDNVGLSYVVGRDARHAELAALFDALLQSPQCPAAVAPLLSAIRARLDRNRAARAAETAATKVDFFTMVREQGSE